MIGPDERYFSHHSSLFTDYCIPKVSNSRRDFHSGNSSTYDTKATSSVKSNIFFYKKFFGYFWDNPKGQGPKGFASGPEVKHAFLELQGIFLT